MRTWLKRSRPRPYGRTVVFIGDSTRLERAYAAAVARGFVSVEIPHPALVCAVVDQAVLSGRRTPAEATALRRIESLGVPCLDPDQAMTWLAELDVRDQLTSA